MPSEQRKIREEEGQSRKELLLKDANVRRWYDNIARGSAASADEWLRRLGRIQDQFNVTPAQLAKMKQRVAEDFLLDVVSVLEKKGNRSEYISNYVKSLKSWWRFSGKRIERKVNLKTDTDEGKYSEEVPPTPDELRRILDMADARTKVAIGIVAFGGTRLESIGSFKGDDGLRFRDLPELRVSDGHVAFEKIPTIVRVRPSVSKAGHAYFTFLPRQACDYLASYLEWRSRSGEELVADSPIFTADIHRKAHVGKHVGTSNVGDAFRKAIRASSYDWRPYVFRRYFASRMQMAEADHLVIHPWVTFWSGWKGDISAVYTTRKGLSQDTVEKMRDSYSKAAEKVSDDWRQEGSHDKGRVHAKFQCAVPPNGWIHG